MGYRSALPDVQLLCGLHEAGLIRLLQHLLGVAHEPAVLQHALVLLHLQDIGKIWTFGGSVIELL